jgi:hypothetical protein
MATKLELSRLKSLDHVTYASEAKNSLFLAIALFFAGFIFCLTITSGPYLIAVVLAVRFKIQSIWFFIIGSLLMGISAAPILALMMSFAVNEPPNEPLGVWISEPTFAEQTLILIPVCSFCGLAGGIATVLTLGRAKS